MRILLLTNKSPWPPHDGGSFATWCLIKGLVDKEMQVTLISLNTSKHYVEPEQIPAGFKDKIDLHLVKINTAINPLNFLLNLFFSDKPYSTERFKSEGFSRELSSVLTEKFDIIQTEGLAMTCYLPLLKKLNHAKIVFRAHNVENIIWQQLAREEFNFVKRWYFNILAARTRGAELKLINDFDALVTFTNDDMSWFLRSGLLKPYLVNPPGIINKETLTATEIKGSVFFIGALDWLPNINGIKWFIKEVWPFVNKEMPDATLHIAGRNASEKLIRKLTGKNISFHGEVESSDLFMADKSIMIVPLFSGSGIRMKILEGMAMGKCIVATPMAAAGISCLDKKDIFISSDSKTFALSVVNLLKDNELRRSTGENAFENLRKNYNNLVAAENLLKFYSELS
jgi:polysaccharide biosynthesis protein PslH